MEFFNKNSCDEVQEAPKEDEFEEYDIYAENSSYLSAGSARPQKCPTPGEGEECAGPEGCKDGPEAICPTDSSLNTPPQEPAELQELQ